MTTLAIPTATPARRPARKWLIVLAPVVAAVVAAGGYYGYTAWRAGRATVASTAKFYTVTAGEMQVKVHKDGELNSVNNTEIMSQVEGISTIVQIVKEGASVNAGDVLVEFDSSAIRQKIEDTTLELQRAESDVATAKNAVEITTSQNQATYEAAEVELELSKLAMAQYVDGTYPQELKAAEITVKMAGTKLDHKDDDFKQIKELYAKKFVNLADLKAAELDLDNLRSERDKAVGALEVLTKYTHPMNLASRQSAMKQAEQKLARVRAENQNNLRRVETALETAETAKKILERRLARTNEQLEHCTIKAPQAGLVVYNNQSSRGDSQPIQEGTQIRERQVMLRLPDTTAMKAVVRINESQVIRLAPGQRGVVRVTGLREPIGASLTRISPVSDSSSRYFSPDTREYPVELALDWTPPGLKPGIGVQVEILVDSIPDAVSVPLTAIYSAGADTFVFTRGPDGQPAARKVNIGVANETHVRVTDGLRSGEEVVLLQAGQGRELLEKAGITPRSDAEPRSRPGNKNKGGTSPQQASPAAGDDERPPREPGGGGGSGVGPGEPNTGSGSGGTSGDRPSRRGGGNKSRTPEKAADGSAPAGQPNRSPVAKSPAPAE